MPEFSKQELVSGIRSRENRIFTYLEKKMWRPVRAHVTLNRGSDQDAEDCYNDSIIVLIRMVDKHDFEPSCMISTLLFEIAKNKWLQKLEKRGPANKYKIMHNEETTVKQYDEEMDQFLYEKIYDDCWKKLHRECRQILRAYMKGMSGKEMAELFDYEATTIRKKKSICHANLREMVHNHPDYKRIKLEETF